MTRIVSVFLSIVVILIVAFGCSSGKSSPVTPVDISTDIPTGEPIGKSRQLLGVWELEFNYESLEAIVTPSRLANTHYQVKYLIPTPEVVINAYYPNYVVDADVTLTNPFTFDAYDVRLILFTDDEPHKLENPDCWTDLYDIPAGMPINPFKAYAKDEPNRVFAGESNHTENLLVFSPPGSHPIQFAVDASFPSNCEEPYTFENFTQGVIQEFIGSQTSVTIDVFDWQDDVNEVYLECPEITGQPQVPFTFVAGNTWQLELVNETGANQGEYNAWIVAKSANSGSLVLYNSATITITPGTCTPLNPQIVGAIYYLNDCRNVTVKGNYAYIGDKYTGFNIVDISNPSEPEVISNIPPSDYFIVDISVTIRGNYAYVSDSDEFKIIDISNPRKPVTIGNVNIQYVQDVAIQDTYAYLIHSNIITIVDISDPFNPEKVGSMPVDVYGDTITIDNSLLFIGSRQGITQGIMTILSLYDPLNPQIIGSLETNGRQVMDIEVSDDFAYLTVSGHGLVIADISNPENPQEVGSIILSSPYSLLNGITVSGDFAYLAAYKSLLICDISDPTNPQEIGEFETGKWATGVDVSGNLAFIANGRHGFLIADITDPQSIIQIGAIYEGVTASSIAVSGNYAYVANSTYYTNPTGEGLTTVDISNPQKPKTVAAVTECAWANDVVVEGNYAYVAAGYYKDDFYNDGKFHIVDITDPVNPIKIASKEIEFGYGIAVSGDYACVADKEYGLKIYNVHNPFNPHRIGACNPGGDSCGVAVKDNYIYVASWDEGLTIVDGSNPTSPEIISLTDMDGYTVDVTVSGDFAYIASLWGDNIYPGFTIVDVSNPQIPEIVSSAVTYDSRDIAISGDYAYIADGEEGLKVFDISDSSNPILFSSLDTSGICCNVIVIENYAYIANGLFGIRIIKLW